MGAVAPMSPRAISIDEGLIDKCVCCSLSLLLMSAVMFVSVCGACRVMFVIGITLVTTFESHDDNLIVACFK